MTEEETQKVTKKEVPEEHHRQVVIPLLQNRGMICEPMVEVDDVVVVGQKIGNCDSDFGADIHSSVSGSIVAVEERAHPCCTKMLSIVIESNGSKEKIKAVTTSNPSKEQILGSLKESGITDLDGIPVYHSLTTGKVVDTVLLNLTNTGDATSNCTPENIPAIINGLRLFIKASGAQQGAFVIEKNNKFASAIRSELDGDDIKIFTVKRNYSPTMLNLLAHDITGMRISSIGTPADAGVIVTSAYAALAVNKAVVEGIPSTHINVSVCGAVRKPGVKRVEIGTSFREVIESCGGYMGTPGKVIMNGAMTGIAQFTDEVPVIKTTTEILVQSEGQVVRDTPGPCIHCARCVDVCPSNILPGMIASFSDIGRYDECDKLHVHSCVECGLCTQVCPSKRHILQLVIYAKRALLKSFRVLDEKESPNLKLGCQSCESPCQLGASTIMAEANK